MSTWYAFVYYLSLELNVLRLMNESMSSNSKKNSIHTAADNLTEKEPTLRAKGKCFVSIHLNFNFMRATYAFAYQSLHPALTYWPNPRPKFSLCLAREVLCELRHTHVAKIEIFCYTFIIGILIYWWLYWNDIGFPLKGATALFLFYFTCINETKEFPVP